MVKLSEPLSVPDDHGDCSSGCSRAVGLILLIFFRKVVALLARGRWSTLLPPSTSYCYYYYYYYCYYFHYNYHNLAGFGGVRVSRRSHDRWLHHKVTLKIMIEKEWCRSKATYVYWCCIIVFQASAWNKSVIRMTRPYLLPISVNIFIEYNRSTLFNFSCF